MSVELGGQSMLHSPRASSGTMGSLGKSAGAPFESLDLGGGGVDDVAAAEVIVVVDAAVGAVHRLVAEAAASEVDHVEIAQLDLRRRTW